MQKPRVTTVSPVWLPPYLIITVLYTRRCSNLNNIKRDMLREYCTDGGSSNLFNFLDGWFTASIWP